MMLTDQETKTLIVALGAARGKKGFTEEEAQIVFDQFDEALAMVTVLKLIIEGETLVDVDADGRLEFTDAPDTWAARLNMIRLKGQF